jgi:hypothetical protein
LTKNFFPQGDEVGKILTIHMTVECDARLEGCQETSTLEGEAGTQKSLEGDFKNDGWYIGYRYTVCPNCNKKWTKAREVIRAKKTLEGSEVKKTHALSYFEKLEADPFAGRESYYGSDYPPDL